MSGGDRPVSIEISPSPTQVSAVWIWAELDPKLFIQVFVNKLMFIEFIEQLANLENFSLKHCQDSQWHFALPCLRWIRRHPGNSRLQA